MRSAPRGMYAMTLMEIKAPEGIFLVGGREVKALIKATPTASRNEGLILVRCLAPIVR